MWGTAGNQVLCFYQTFVLLDSLLLRNPALLKPANCDTTQLRGQNSTNA